MKMPEIKLKPCPFCGSTDIRLSIKRAKYPYWYSAMYCNSCHCYGARTRFVIEKEGYISEREIKASTNAESMAVDAWNRRYQS